MIRSIHEHQWAYLGDLALVVSKKETDVNLRRMEYCVGCSSVRVQFPSGWYEMQGDATKELLAKCDGESPGKVLKIAPLGFRPQPPKTGPSRLGRTLKDLSLRQLPSTAPFKK